MKFIFLFIDGVGLREPATDNPITPEVCPALCRLFARHAVPIDACLAVDGLPQSATGQATMFTGVNAPVFMGRHCEGFPGPSLRKKIEEGNLFLSLKKRGKRVCFADAYLVEDAAELAARRFKSVTTVMALTTPEVIATADDLTTVLALTTPEVIATADDLADDQAVMQDLTRETIQDRYPDIPVISPEDAAAHLFALARVNDFTLYEFFQTDVAGYSMDYARACEVLRLYDRFLAALLRYVEAAGLTLVMTSDHGNIESMDEQGHTRNPVPFVVFGPKEAEIRAAVKSLVDVTPAILRFI